jgi:hypothetical protein
MSTPTTTIYVASIFDYGDEYIRTCVSPTIEGLYEQLNRFFDTNCANEDEFMEFVAEENEGSDNMRILSITEHTI